MKKVLTAGLCFFILSNGKAQTISVQEYINTYKDLAIAEMQRTGVPASITLAQGLLETESGNSDLVKRSNNHFGIKCKSTWTGETVTHTDDAPNECFRKYSKAEDSYKDHSNYLSSTPRYASLFRLDAADYRGWCYGLKQAGYATNPRYPQILIGNIEKYNLQQYDLPGGQIIFADGTVVNENRESKKTDIVPVEPDAKAIDNSLKGKLSFNGLKAVLAAKGTSLLAIAIKADIPLAKLLEFNDLIADGLISEEQYIYLEKKSKEGNRDYYTALQNESLYDISQNNGIQLASLAAFNGLSANAFINKGKKIKLRQTATNEQALLHIVQPKEGLYSISKKYSISIQHLMELNHLTGDTLSTGQQLIISN